jgi:HAD superfamily hydrolase (TIGR01509 family)
MSILRALLWDVDGTLAETERDGHREAFNAAFAGAGLPWRWDVARYGELLRITGGRERLLHDMSQRQDAPPTAQEREDLAQRLHAQKNALYGDIVRSGRLPLRPGVRELIEEAAEAGVRQCIVTTTSRVNVEALMGVHFGAHWSKRFDGVICGEDVRIKKPDPEAYALALAKLDLPATECLAIEDSPGGVAAAQAAGIPVVVPLSAYFRLATIDHAAAIGPGLHTRDGWRPSLHSQPAASGLEARVQLDDLAAWLAEGDRVSQFG